MISKPHVLIFFAAAFLVGGCSSSLRINLKDAASEKPLAGIRVERARPVSTAAKLFNPVGSFYHPLEVAESGTTDSNGDFTFAQSGRGDVYRVYAVSQPFDGTVQGLSVRLAPDAKLSPAKAWSYAVWLEDGALRHSTWPVKQ